MTHKKRNTPAGWFQLWQCKYFFVIKEMISACLSFYCIIFYIFVKRKYMKIINIEDTSRNDIRLLEETYHNLQQA